MHALPGWHVHLLPSKMATAIPWSHHNFRNSPITLNLLRTSTLSRNSPFQKKGSRDSPMALFRRGRATLAAFQRLSCCRSTSHELVPPVAPCWTAKFPPKPHFSRFIQQVKHLHQKLIWSLIRGCPELIRKLGWSVCARKSTVPARRILKGLLV